MEPVIRDDLLDFLVEKKHQQRVNMASGATDGNSLQFFSELYNNWYTKIAVDIYS